MVNYQNGKIYKIFSYSTTDIYVGSTCDLLCNRLKQHKYQFKKNKEYVSSFEILKYDDVKIELIVNYPCNSKEELTREEGKHIRELDCVNKNIAGRTKAEYWIENNQHLLQKKKEYYEKNKEEIIEKQKVYVENNLEKTMKYQQEYRDSHKEETKLYNETYRTENREELLEKKKEWYEKTKGQKAVCDICGMEILKRSLLRHQKRKH